MTTRKARDQVLGKTQAAGLKPAVNGIAGRRLAGLVSRATSVADALHTVLAARDSGDPTAVAIAEKLLENKEFIASMIAAVEKIKAEVTASGKPAPAAAEPVANGNGLEEGNSPNHKSGSVPGADSRTPGSYTVANLLKDIQTQNGAVAQLAAKTGLDAARAQVAASPLIPAWDSSAWTPEARQAFRDRASYDGAAAAILKQAGDLPAHVRDQDTNGAAALYALHPEAYDR